MTLKYRPSAVKDIQNSVDYIEQMLKNPSAARSLKVKLLQNVSLLKENPYIGTPLCSKYDGLETDIRFLVVNHQLVFYQVFKDVIEIIRVLNGRTDYLPRLFEIDES